MIITKSQKTVLLVVSGLLLVFYVFTLYVNNDIEVNEKQTVGFVYGFFEGPSNGPELSYEYFVDGKKYKGGVSLKNKDYDQYRNRFYQVTYSSVNPNFSKILLNRPVTDTILIKDKGFSIPKKKRNQFQEQ